ncbi:hypothetical protein GCM10023231_39420 [Olivibacter ginsenosidimutans]|uniref:HTH araC/xylS-type domain-containing protein n=1 Tax=Olivibacter ginsenosidimutans TaxID=1176537 RepID=A0ABP9CAI2_9SPHI
MQYTTKPISLLTFQEIFHTETVRRLSAIDFSDELMEFSHQYLIAKHRVIKLDGVCLIYRDWTLPAPITMPTKHEQPFLKMQFELEGHSEFTSKVAITYKNIDILHGKHTLLFLPEVDGTLFYPHSRKVLDVIFSPAYFERLFGPDLRCLGALGQAIQTNQPILIGQQSKAITPAMSRIILEIMHCNLQGIFKKTYLEAKVIELLNLQIDQFFHDATPVSPTLRLCKEDIDKFHYIKELIHQHPGANYSLRQLAETAGMNDFKLKKGFKQLFGNTVFGYLNDVRMQQSFQMLQEGNRSITEVAYAMGYKYPHHFSHAFKKKFGFLPKDAYGKNF